MAAPDEKNLCSVRVAASADLAAMADLHAACFPRGWAAKEIGVFVTDPACVALIGSVASSGQCHGLLVARIAADEAELLTLCVDQAYRRRGLAASLLGAAVAVLKDRGAKQLLLEVEAGNTAAVSLYSGLGATKVGTRPAYYEHGADAAIFSLAL